MRKHAADLLGISTAYLRELVQEGSIKTAHDAKGRERYEPASLIEIQGRLEERRKKKDVSWARTPGDLAAEAFRLFAQGADLRRVVTELRMVVDDVRKLHTEYLEAGAEMVLSGTEVAELRDLLDWRSPTGASLVEAVGRRLRAQFARGQQSIIDEYAEKQSTEGATSGKDRRTDEPE